MMSPGHDDVTREKGKPQLQTGGVELETLAFTRSVRGKMLLSCIMGGVGP